MNVFDLVAVLTLDNSDYTKGLDSSQKEAESFGGKVGQVLGTAGKIGATAIAAVTTGAVAMGTALTKGVGNIAEYGDNIDKMSQKMGISAQAYQEWDAIMQHSGTSIDALKPSMKTLAQQAEKGSDAFQKLGISEEEVASLSQEDLFARVITGLQNMEEGTERTALTAELLGRGATELGALLNTSAEDTEKMRQKVHELGGVMSDEAVKASAEFQDKLQDMKTGFSALSRNMLSEFMPAFSGVMDGLTDLFTGDVASGSKKIGDGIKNITNKISEMLPQIFKVGGDILKALTESIIENLPQIADAAVDVIIELGNALIEALPELLEAGLQIILSLAESISEALPELIPTIVDVVMQIVEILTRPETLSGLVEGAIAIMMGLANGLIQAIPVIIERLPQIITNIINGLIACIPQLVEGAVQMVVMLVTHLPEIIMALIQALPQVITAIVEGLAGLGGALMECLSKAWDTAKEAFANVGGWFKDKFNNAKEKAGEAWSGIKDKFSESYKKQKEVYSKIGDWFSDKFKNAKERSVKAWDNVKEKFSGIWKKIKGAFKFGDARKWGKDMIDNFIKGVKDMFGKLGETLGNVAGKVKDFLGFSEPKKGPLSNFHTYAPDMMNLFMQGIKDNEQKLQDTVAEAFNFKNLIGNGGKLEVGVAGAEVNAPAIAENRVAPINLTVNVYGTDKQNTRELAQVVTEQMSDELRRLQKAWA